MKTLIALTVLNTLISAVTFWNTELSSVQTTTQLIKMDNTLRVLAIYTNEKTYQGWKTLNQ